MEKRKKLILNNYAEKIILMINYQIIQKKIIKYLFSYNNFTKYYQDNLKENIIREKEDDKEIFHRVKSNSKYKKFARKGYYLSNKIIKYYINYLNNNFSNIGKLFGLIKLNQKYIRENHSFFENKI